MDTPREIKSGSLSATLYHADNIEVLRSLPNNSVDAVVTDPPAGIAFMNKTWDEDKGGRDAWIEWLASIMRECLRTLKPGGYCLVWALPRTSHWTATAIENAGFEIRDNILNLYDGQKDVEGFLESLSPEQKSALETILSQGDMENNAFYHVFGTGFPKSLNISKVIDKMAGATREVIGSYLPPDGHLRTAKRGETVAMGKPNSSEWNTPITAPATEAAKQYEGFGTALKPAAETWVLARKPLIGTIAENVIRHGTGGLNIDGCRVGNEVITQTRTQMKTWRAAEGRTDIPDSADNSQTTTQGRWPANVVHDGSEGVVGRFPDTKNGGQNATSIKGNGMFANGSKTLGSSKFANDSGSAARFFYCAKTSPRDRNEGCGELPDKTTKLTSGAGMGNTLPKCPEHNASLPSCSNTYSCGCGLVYRQGQSERRTPVKNDHPTVKSTSLMRWLCRLVTPPNGTVLDPFMGSGSTGKACMLEGFNFIGIEKEANYLDIAEARIKHALSGQVAEDASEDEGVDEDVTKPSTEQPKAEKNDLGCEDIDLFE